MNYKELERYYQRRRSREKKNIRLGIFAWLIVVITIIGFGNLLPDLFKIGANNFFLCVMHEHALRVPLDPTEENLKQNAINEIVNCKENLPFDILISGIAVLLNFSWYKLTDNKFSNSLIFTLRSRNYKKRRK